ncbi:Vacuolar protein sorting-associated protein 51 [Corchorus olitorius]|uniref:Vacuolar protein sorting-associated protein 51 n=1 Tax=Corchorus olitorius TaxID=93759 RepID=A0A1R3GAB4_9ROSI|nr:Vacuolar protein sorting-associated protein 51 [Corchorus olitorius]
MSIGDSAELESKLSLSDRLKEFKSSQFDPDAYLMSKCHAMTEKDIKHASSHLMDLRKASAEEMRKSVYANYTAFIRTSKEITVLEGELLSMRNLLSTQAALVHGLAEGIIPDSLSAGPEDPEEEDIYDVESTKLTKTDKWFVEYLDNIEVLLAEKRVEEAMAALDEGEQLAKENKSKHTLSPDTLLKLKNALTVLRQRLVDQLAEATCQPFTRGAELRKAILAIKKLGDGPRAHTLLLNSHQQALQRGMQSLHPSSTSHGGSAFSSGLSQLVFSTIAQAASDSLAVFGEEPAYSSELVTWAVKQTEAFALLLKRHVLASSAAAGGLRVATECIQICLGHCSLLEARGLSLSPVLMRLFKPSVELAFSANLKRIEQCSAALAAADDWVLTYAPVGSRPFSSTSLSISQPKLSSSAHKFISMVQDFLEDVGPLESLQLDGPALEGVLRVFDSYVNLLINALPGSMETEEQLEGTGSKIVRVAENETQQMALLANASLLADELLPRAAMKLLPLSQSNNRVDTTPRRGSDKQSRLPEQREWKRKLQRSVERLRDSFCRIHALEIIFTEDGDVRLNSQIYISLDGNAEEPEWFPSPIFQEFFEKLTRMASIATDMFAERAIEAVTETGIDPYSVLPEDDWFAEVAQIAIKMLTGKANFSNMDRDTSPTASVSAKSISSVLSHGSN